MMMCFSFSPNHTYNCVLNLAAPTLQCDCGILLCRMTSSISEMTQEHFIFLRNPLTLLLLTLVYTPWTLTPLLRGRSFFLTILSLSLIILNTSMMSALRLHCSVESNPSLTSLSSLQKHCCPGNILVNLLCVPSRAITSSV